MNQNAFSIVLALLFLAKVQLLQGIYNEPKARQVLQKQAWQFRQHCANAPSGSAVAKCCSAIRSIMGRFTNQTKAMDKTLAKCRAGTTESEQKFHEFWQYCNNGAENEEENAELSERVRGEKMKGGTANSTNK
ncbi:hypothetical protein niasHS_007040 [Heterodera schachtii]|uniref:Uncharacterized protein n=1 Tax=Heterodera schachtii TaxID=97005 RepID=A0ABD2JFS4_HETSC